MKKLLLFLTILFTGFCLLMAGLVVVIFSIIDEIEETSNIVEVTTEASEINPLYLDDHSHDEEYIVVPDNEIPEPKEEKGVLSMEELLNILLPQNERLQITQITAETDGPSETLAYVEPIHQSGSVWKLAYDPIDTYTGAGDYQDLDELLETLLHEYAHVLTLDHKQVRHVPLEIEEFTCNTGEIIIDEGCARADSYLVTFVDAFWSERDRVNAFNSAVDGVDFSVEMFEARPFDFVTEYAATNEAEDIAESFFFFVLNDKPVPETLADEKILFFYNYPELEELRYYLRASTKQISNLYSK